MPRGNHYRPLKPGLPNARRTEPAWLAAWSALCGNVEPMTKAEAIAEYDRMGVEEDARRSAQQALPLRGGA